VNAVEESHECVFVEEQEPSGRLVIPPCIVCGTTAMDALDTLVAERDRLAVDVKAAAEAHFDWDLKSNPQTVLDEILGPYREGGLS
jgi:hypothetical protein